MITRYCTCGAAMRVRATPVTVEKWLAAEFQERHTGAGHGPATQTIAARARRREDLALIPREDASRVEVHCEACGGPCRNESDLDEGDLSETYPGSGIYE